MAAACVLADRFQSCLASDSPFRRADERVGDCSDKRGDIVPFAAVSFSATPNKLTIDDVVSAGMAGGGCAGDEVVRSVVLIREVADSLFFCASTMAKTAHPVSCISRTIRPQTTGPAPLCFALVRSITLCCLFRSRGVKNLFSMCFSVLV